MFKAVLALHHRILPPTIKVDRPNPDLHLETGPFYLNTRARPWIRDASHPRRAGVSSFGFGGSNYHLTLEEYRGPAKRAYRLRTAPTEMVVLSAGSAEELASRCRTMAKDAAKDGMLGYLARSTQAGFDARANHRVAVVASDGPDLAQKLDLAASLAETPATGAMAPAPPGIYLSGRPLEGETAFLFPGQGSQYLGMGADLAMSFEEARAPWDMAADLDLAPDARLHEVVFPIPCFEEEERAAQEARLVSTGWAQPALGATSLGQLALLAELGIKPRAVAGHSFGELVALHAASVFGSEDLLRIARRRGELMAEAALKPGAMTAVAADITTVSKLLAEWGSDVVIANHNGPRQVVLSGTREAIAEIEQRLATASLRTTRLDVAAAFHSPLVNAAVGPLLKFLQGMD